MSDLPRRYEVGDKAPITIDRFKNVTPEVGKEYTLPDDLNNLYVAPKDEPLDNLPQIPCNIRIDSIDGDICHCTITKTFRDV